ncbi:MAG: hypothetical protein ACK4XJ_11540 [Fimbriimonadaceae bacterium]
MSRVATSVQSRGRRKSRLPWVLAILLVFLVVLFWVLPGQIGAHRMEVEFVESEASTP